MLKKITILTILVFLLFSSASIAQEIISSSESSPTVEPVTITIDSTPPTIYKAKVTPNPVTSNSQSINLTTNVSENSIIIIKLINKLTNVTTAYIIQTTNSTNTTNITASYSWDYSNQSGLAGPEDGLYKFELKAEDNAGNQSQPYIIDNIRIDRTPPVIFANYCTPYLLSNTEEKPYIATLHYRLSESNDKPVNQLTDINVKIDVSEKSTGASVITETNAGTSLTSDNTYDFDASSPYLSRGVYEFKITATDELGNSSVAYATTVKDGIMPMISFPEENQTVGGVISICGTAMDPDWTNSYGFKDYRVYYAQGNQSTNPDPNIWKSDFVEVPEINRAEQKNTSIRPLQNDSTLAYLYTNDLENRTYTIMLVVDEADGGGSYSCFRTIKISNK